MISPKREPQDETGGVDAGSRCPTCGARRTERAVCHRCGSDLSLLLSVEVRAAALHERALSHYDAGRYRLALTLAAESARLRASSETLELLACAALRAGEFSTAQAAAERRLFAKQVAEGRSPSVFPASRPPASERRGPAD